MKRKVHFQTGPAKRLKRLDDVASIKNCLEEWLMSNKGVAHTDLKLLESLIRTQVSVEGSSGAVGDDEYHSMVEMARKLVVNGTKRQLMTQDALREVYIPPSEDNQLENLPGATVRVLCFETLSGAEYPVQFSRAWCQRLIAGSSRPYWVEVPFADYNNTDNWL